MEKIKFDRFIIKDLDKIKKKAYYEILQDPSIKEFIQKNNINESVVYENLGYFITYLENKDVCNDCDGYFNCKSTNPGFVCELVYDERTKQINIHYRTCDKYIQILRQKQGFLFYEYDQSLFDERLRNQVDITKSRKEVLSRIGSILNKKDVKGMYVYGKSGVGKSYLLAIMANGVVESGRTCAFIRSSTLIDHLRTLLIDDNALFNEEINKYKNVEVLIIDDLGGEKTTVWARDEVLFSIIDYRSKNKDLITCFTSNYSMDEYQRTIFLGDAKKAERLVNRISLVADEMELIDIDRR